MPRTWRQNSEQAIQGLGFKSPSVGSKYLGAFSLTSVVLISSPGESAAILVAQPGLRCDVAEFNLNHTKAAFTFAI
jgi:hypothetical protein